MLPTRKQLAKRFETLGSWGSKELDAILGELEPVALSAGDTLVAEGDHSDAVYLVWEGDLAVKVAVGDEVEDVGVVRPGAIVGEVSLMDPGPATATLVASAPAIVLALRRTSLDDLRRSNPRAATAVIQTLGHTLAERLRIATEELEELRGMPTGQPAKRGFLTAMGSLLGLRKAS